MRALWVSIAAALLGVAAAWGTTAYEFRRPEEVVPKHDAAVAQPRVVVDGGNVFDFGTMQVGDTQKHTFVLRNIGNAPLELIAGRPSCKCTVSEFSTEPVMPGESREVLLSWTPMGAEEKFRQRAPIYTNDPEQRELALQVSGRVAEFYKMEPNPLTLGQFSPLEEMTHDIKVWGYQATPWKFRDFQCLEAETAEIYSLTARDMTSEEIAGAPGAVNGQVLTLTIKPGLPLGNVRQRLTIAYNDGQGKPAELAIEGKAVGDITVVGKDFNSTGDYLDLGNIPKSAGKKSHVSLLVKGPYRDRVKFTIKEVDPQNSLQVKLGEPMEQGKSVSWPLFVEVLSGTEPINRLGSELGRLGRIELEAGTPDVAPFVLKVRFSVTGE
jgi:hypothetical protein